VTNNGVIGTESSQLNIFGPVGGTGHLLLSGSGGILELHSDTAQAVQFAANAGSLLQLDYQQGSAAPAVPGIISGFDGSDSILFNGYAATSNSFVTYLGYNAINNTTSLFISNDSDIDSNLSGLTLVFSGQYLPGHFELTGIPGESLGL